MAQAEEDDAPPVSPHPSLQQAEQSEEHLLSWTIHRLESNTNLFVGSGGQLDMEVQVSYNLIRANLEALKELGSRTTWTGWDYPLACLNQRIGKVVRKFQIMHARNASKLAYSNVPKIAPAGTSWTTQSGIFDTGVRRELQFPSEESTAQQDIYFALFATSFLRLFESTTGATSQRMYTLHLGMELAGWWRERCLAWGVDILHIF